MNAIVSQTVTNKMSLKVIVDMKEVLVRFRISLEPFRDLRLFTNCAHPRIEVALDWDPVQWIV